jgi:hypothetical protein
MALKTHKVFYILLITLCVTRAQLIEDYESSSESNQAQQLPLTIKQQPQSQIAIKGNRVTFKCDFEASSAASNDVDATTATTLPRQMQSTQAQTIDYSIIKVSWLHNSRPVEATSSNEQSSLSTLNANKYVLDRNSLVILSFEPHTHNGQYRCMINNTMFSPPLIMLSEPADLSAASMSEFQVEHSSELVSNLEMSEGNVAIIGCKLPQSNPPAVPIFYLNDNVLVTEVMDANAVDNRENSFNRYKVFPSGNLQISNVRHKDTGVYKCAARNPITNEIKASTRRVHLKVNEPFGTKLPDIIYAPVDTNRVRVGGNLTLECVANGAPVPLVSWEKFGGTLPPEKRSAQIYGNLILTNVQLEDKGTYVCRAENGPGQATFKTAMVDVFESPSTIGQEIAPTSYTAKNGQTVQLKCPIKSRPRADIQWFYQGRLLTSNQLQRIQTVGDQSLLTLKKFHSSTSTGIYQCYAQNEYGFKQVNLLIIPFDVKSSSNSNANNTPKRPVIIMGPQNTTIYEGQSVVLLCVTGGENAAAAAAASSSTQINWLQNDLIIEPTLMRRFEINQLLGNLRIVSIQKSDAGIYKCIASNEFGMSTAEAHVQVKSTTEVGGVDEVPVVTNKKEEDLIAKQLPQASRPIIQQIGHDKILLKWNVGANNLNTANNNIAYFKVEYKTNKQQQQIPGIQPNTWLTIDEQIDSKKREYILTDLSKHDTYRFRITTFFLNGELNHSHQSTRFKLESTWTDLVLPLTTKPASANFEIKLSQIQVQITQIWAIAASSLGLKWNVFLLEQKETSLNSVNLILSKINGFYVYYRKLSPSQSNQVINVPLYNYTRLNIPISSDAKQKQLIETHMIANLEPETQYEIKMTCYNLNGDLCSFSNTVTGLTLSGGSTPSQRASEIIRVTNSNSNLNNIEQAVLLKTKQNEILFMILGIVLGILTLLLIIFVLMCLMRHRQHKRLLAQLQNTSQKLASSSCPTLIYEDSLRHHSQTNTNHHSQTQQRLNLHHYNQNGGMGSIGGNDSNSTNSQSMSTTTSSMTTPPALNSAQTQSDQQISHVLLLNGNTVSASSLQPAPPIPNAPPPSIFPPNNTSTLNRMNINLNPLNTYLENSNSRFINPLMSPSKQNQNQENFYHTLTTLGNLPTQTAPTQASNDFCNEAAAAAMFADYNNATLNIRAQIMLKQQQQQQQIQLMNTLLKQQQHFNNMNTLEKNNSSSKSGKSPSTSSMRRKNLLNSSKKSKKSLKKHDSNLSDKNVNSSSINSNLDDNNLLQQTKNYYLLPNMRTQQQQQQNNNSNNIYNDVSFLTLEAALNQGNRPLFNSANNALGNFYLLNQPQASHLLQHHPVYNSSISTFSPNHLIQQQPLLMSPSKIASQQNAQNAGDVNIFDTKNTQLIDSNPCTTATNNNSNNKEISIYESSDMDINPSEQDPMLVNNNNNNSNHYASSGLLLTKNVNVNKKQYSEKENNLDEQRQLI